MRFLKNKKGFTFIELVVAMAIMALLGAAVSGLVKTGLNSYRYINADLAYENEARTAMSLITVQIRKHDETGAISVPYNTALTVKEVPSSSVSGGTKIWFANGYLYSQSFANLNDITSAETALEIAAIADLDIQRDIDEDGTILYTIEITYRSSGVDRVLTQTVVQRSAA